MWPYRRRARSAPTTAPQRVEIVIEPNTVLIRWKEGFSKSNDQWLRNLKTDVLWRIAE